MWPLLLERARPQADLVHRMEAQHLAVARRLDRAQGLLAGWRAAPTAPSGQAAALAWLAGLGFGLPCGYGIWYFADRGHVWTFLGFPAYGEGPFDDIGIKTTVPLLVLFLLVCVAELIAGWLLWHHRRAGAVLALALLPLELAFWIGFALPAGPVLGLARTALVLPGWPSPGRTVHDDAGRGLTL